MNTAPKTLTQLSLPGQTHMADGPHDQTGMYVMHFAFRRDLDDFVAAARQTPVGEAPVWRALLSRWEDFAGTLHHHHTVEDEAFWPVLLAHATNEGSATDREMLEAMESEHAVIDPELAACHEGFRSMVDHPCADHRNALDVRLTGLRAALLDHLRHEETEALPMLQRTMTSEEYAGCERAAAKGYPLRTVPFMVPWVLKELPEDGRRRMYELAGNGYRIVDLLVRRRFTRRERLAFRCV